MTDPVTPETPESTEALTVKQVVDIVNSAITGHLKRQPDSKTLIAEALAEFKKSLPAPEPEAPTKGKTGSDAAVTALQQKIDDLTKAYDTADKARQAAELKQREDRAYGELKSALHGKVRPEALNDVAKLLFIADRRVETDEQGNAFLKVKRAPAPGLAEEDVLMPLSDGVDTYLKKEGQIYVPAAGTSTNQPVVPRGSRMPQPVLPAGQIPKFQGEAKTDAEKIERAMAMEQALIQQGFGQR